MGFLCYLPVGLYVWLLYPTKDDAACPLTLISRSTICRSSATLTLWRLIFLSPFETVRVMASCSYCFFDLFLHCIWGAWEFLRTIDSKRGENKWWWWGWSFVVLNWRFSRVFGEGSAGEEVQEGILSSIHFPVFFYASVSI